MEHAPLTPTDKRLILQHVLGISHEEYVRTSPVHLSQGQQQHFEQCVKRRLAGEPVAKIIGHKSFWRDAFYTSADTLDPRPESEHIIEAVLKHRTDQQHPHRILDCGTGTGCLLLSLLQEFPQATGHGIDLSGKALSIAQRNADRLQLQNRASFEKICWTNLKKSLYDIVVSNPPYIRTSDLALLEDDVIKYDPLGALDGGEDGLNAYREIFALMQTALDRNGLFVCEAGYDQADEIIALGQKADMVYVDTICDIDGIERTLVFKHAE